MVIRNKYIELTMTEHGAIITVLTTKATMVVTIDELKGLWLCLAPLYEDEILKEDNNP